MSNDLGPHKLLYSPDEACEALSCCKTTLYKMMRQGHLDVRRLGGKKTVIMAASLRALVELLPKAVIEDPFHRESEKTDRPFLIHIKEDA